VQINNRACSKITWQHGLALYSKSIRPGMVFFRHLPQGKRGGRNVPHINLANFFVLLNGKTQRLGRQPSCCLPLSSQPAEHFRGYLQWRRNHLFLLAGQPLAGLPCLPGYRVIYSDLTPPTVPCLCCVERMRFFEPPHRRSYCLLVAALKQPLLLVAVSGEAHQRVR
jgi:hypothetical protein